MAHLTGWRYALFISTIVGGTLAAIYPIVIYPMINPNYYSEFSFKKIQNILLPPCVQHSSKKLCRVSFPLSEELQKKTRAGIRQEDIQPGSE